MSADAFVNEHKYGVGSSNASSKCHWWALFERYLGIVFYCCLIWCSTNCLGKRSNIVQTNDRHKKYSDDHALIETSQREWEILQIKRQKDNKCQPNVLELIKINGSGKKRGRPKNAGGGTLHLNFYWSFRISIAIDLVVFSFNNHIDQCIEYNFIFKQ